MGKYYIKAEPSSFTIYERKVRKEGENAGKPYGEAVKFYGNIEQCARGLRDILMLEKLQPLGELDTTKITQAIVESNQEIRATLKEFYRK